MTSTRNKNSQNDYRLEEKNYQRIFEIRTDKNNINNNNLGFNVNKLPASYYSNNYIDIESNLFGINSNNLTNVNNNLPKLNDLQLNKTNYLEFSKNNLNNINYENIKLNNKGPPKLS